MTTTAATHKLLRRALTRPAKVASALDWKKVSGSVLSLEIHSDRIGMCVASHPSYGQSCDTLEPIYFSRQHKHLTITGDCKLCLSDVIHDYNVCGMVVGWPLQQDTGKMGAACGRVLFALEELLKLSNDCEPVVLSPNRPLCLWDSAHHHSDDGFQDDQKVDEFGRDASLCRTSNKEIYIASKERYHEDEKMVAAKVWDDFRRVHWPEFFYFEDRFSGEPTRHADLMEQYRTANGTSWRGKDDDNVRKDNAHLNALILFEKADKRSMVQRGR
jgi:hypothetical protein